MIQNFVLFGLFNDKYQSTKKYYQEFSRQYMVPTMAIDFHDGAEHRVKYAFKGRGFIKHMACFTAKFDENNLPKVIDIDVRQISTSTLYKVNGIGMTFLTYFPIRAGWFI
jgi:hypothetical protein